MPQSQSSPCLVALASWEGGGEQTPWQGIQGRDLEDGQTLVARDTRLRSGGWTNTSGKGHKVEIWRMDKH